MVLTDELLYDFSCMITKVFTLIDEEKYEELEQYEVKELLNRQLTHLELLDKQFQKLHVDKVSCYPIKDYKEVSQNGMTIFKTTAKISFERYITDNKNDVVFGVKDYVIDTWYEVSFIINQNYNKPCKCTSCGAIIPAGKSKCEYCKTPASTSQSSWLIYDMEEKKIEDPLEKTKEAQRKFSEESWKKIIRDAKDNYHL